MIKNFRERVADFFQRIATPSPLNEASSLHGIALQHPHLYEFIERKYGVKTDAVDRTLSLHAFSEKYGLPPAGVLFMEVQMSQRTQRLKPLSAREARELIYVQRDSRILDVREEWESAYGQLPRSQPLKPALLDEILQEWPKDTKILLYCHYGIRSLDAATFLSDRGFTQVHTLEGGIEAWSREIDPSLPSYDGAYC